MRRVFLKHLYQYSNWMDCNAPNYSLKQFPLMFWHAGLAHGLTVARCMCMRARLKCRGSIVQQQKYALESKRVLGTIFRKPSFVIELICLTPYMIYIMKIHVCLFDQCWQDENCLVPVLTPGFSWIEVSYAKPYSVGCLQRGGNFSSSHPANNDLGQSPCEGSFVYVGDLLSAARSVRLSPYRPRWALLFLADIPYILGNGLSSLLQASAALAVVNCLPVSLYFAEWMMDYSVLTACNMFAWLCLEEDTLSRIWCQSYSIETLQFSK
jgi:hypothetical protein